MRKVHEEQVAIHLDDDDDEPAAVYKPQIVVQFCRATRAIKVMENGAGANQHQLESWARPGTSHNAKSRETDAWCVCSPPLLLIAAPRGRECMHIACQAG